MNLIQRALGSLAWRVKSLFLWGERKVAGVGHSFPHKDLKGQTGRAPELADPGRTVFYFYPKDDTPGCTIEAKEFSQIHGAFLSSGHKIYGVSADGEASHNSFCEKYQIAFSLLTDEGGRVGDHLGIWRGGYHARSTYVVEASGKILKVFADVSPQGHAQAVLEACS